MSDYNPLGKTTEYIDQYDPGLLFPIARSESRQTIDASLFIGFDRWTAYEVSWLDSQGKPQMRIAEFVLDCDSPNIIESKSLKLYLNSFNQTRVNNERQFKLMLTQDLSEAAGAAVLVNVSPLHYAKALIPQEPMGTCLDNLELSISHYQPEPTLLQLESNSYANEVVYSHLLRTNCPVTNQPDWATVFIEYKGARINHASLLEYIVSYRDHQGFHENSVESLFCDIQTQCTPELLAVYARYTRRGGIDINPLRSSYPVGKSLLEANILRSIRQ